MRPLPRPSVLRGAVPADADVDRRWPGLRPQRPFDTERGERRGVDPVGDLAHRVERRLGAGSERGQRAGELGWRVAILLRMLELDDQRHELVLDAVVQVSFQTPALVVASEVGMGSRGTRRHRLNVARGGHRAIAAGGAPRGAVRPRLRVPGFGP